MTEDETPREPNTDPATPDNPDEPNFAPSETAPEAAAPQPEPAPAGEPQDPQPAEAAPPPDDAVALQAERTQALEAELADANDKLLRALAEAENVRRRAQRDKEDASKYAIKGFAEDMLRVADNMGRALAAIDADARAQDANLENIAVGVEMVHKELLTAFERAGVKPIEAQGARFDPMLHEAMFEIEDPSQPAGTIAQVLEEGFTLHGRTLRAAKVGVTKGGPKAEPQPAEGEDATAADGQRDGQQAYETKSDGPTETGAQLDEKL